MTLDVIKAKDMITKGNYHPNFMIIGESGAGKTSALKTLPPKWKVLVLDMFGNKESLEGTANIDLLTYSDWLPSQPEAYMEVQKDQRKIISALHDGSFPYQVIVVDTITGLLRLQENHILATNPEGKGIGGAAAQHHYRGLAHISNEFILSFVGFPVTVILIAHSELREDKATGTTRHMAIISGARMRATIYSYVGEVYRAFAETTDKLDEKGEPITQYIWQTQPDIQWPMLKSVMNTNSEIWGKYVEPNFEKLLKRRKLI